MPGQMHQIIPETWGDKFLMKQNLFGSMCQSRKLIYTLQEGFGISMPHPTPLEILFKLCQLYKFETLTHSEM